MLDEFDLTGKVAIVTGGHSPGDVIDQVRGLGRRSLGVPCDVTAGDDIARTVAAVLEELGRIDILVNNAEISLGGPPETLGEESWDRVLDTNLKAVLRFSQAVYPALKEDGGDIGGLLYR